MAGSNRQLFYQWNPKMNRAFLILSVLLLTLVAAILWWAQAGQEQSLAVMVIKQLTIAVLLLLVLGFVLWLMKNLLDSSNSLNESESLTMRVRDGKDETKGPLPVGGGLPPMSADLVAPLDTQAELDEIRAMIAKDPEKVAQIVKRWIGASD
jgi:flagellar biosynthesis/type III secretory pathway M-ring protein FliF/YscJ